MSVQYVEAKQIVLESLFFYDEPCLTKLHFSTAVRQAIFKLIRKIKEDGQ